MSKRKSGIATNAASARTQEPKRATKRELVDAINAAIAAAGEANDDVIGEALLAALYSWTSPSVRAWLLGKA